MADPQEEELNPISCKRCRTKKIRCNRRMPVCNRCEEQDAECLYARRMQRGPVRTTGDRVGSIERVLATVVQRLDRLEDRMHFQPQHISPRFSTGASQYQSEPSEHVVSHAGRSVELEASSSTCSSSLASGRERSPGTSLESSMPTSILQNAIDQVQHLVGQHRNSPTSTVDVFHIEPGLVKSWIKSYFAHLSEDLFPAFLNVRLIELMPDIIGLPNVHLDASICVVYYCILYHGCLLHQQSTPASENVETRSKLYHQCLRALLAWEPYATGTTTDFVAAFFMVRVAAERFELELSWTMFRRACQYAEKIELHRLDNSVGSAFSSLGSSVLEASRKGFWELVNMDIYFHLIHDKPPAIVGVARYNAQVNLPWVTELGLQQSEAETEEITTLRFLIDSRRSFILMEFLQLLEHTKAKPDPELVSKTEALCHKIEALYEQWEIDEWVKKMIASNGQLWTLAGLAMEGYICILFMLRHAITTATPRILETEALELDVARLPLTLKASRHVLAMVDLLLNAIPFMATVSVTFAVLQAHLPYAYLVTNLLYSTTSHDYGADLALLKRVSGGLKMISRNVVELAPLTAAIDNLNMMVCRRLRQHESKDDF